jgi:hypothetical protein
VLTGDLIIVTHLRRPAELLGGARFGLVVLMLTTLAARRWADSALFDSRLEADLTTWRRRPTARSGTRLSAQGIWAVSIHAPEKSKRFRWAADRLLMA